MNSSSSVSFLIFSLVIDYENTKSKLFFRYPSPNCSEINENLIIGQFNSDITDLSPLSQIEMVRGDLIIQLDNHVVDLSVFDNLKEIGRDLRIAVTVTTDIPFPNVEKVGNDLTVSGGSLTDIAGFNNLISVEEDFLINGSGNLLDITGFQKLEKTGGDFSIYLNSELESISSFNELDSIFGRVQISDNPSLTAISGFNNLVHIGTDLYITSTGFTSLSGFPQLNDLGNDLYLSGNNNLELIDGFENLTYINGGLTIRFCSSMDTLEAFPSLTEVGEDILIEFNESLTEIKGFSAVTNVIKGISFRDNDVLKDINGFENLEALDGWLWFQNNPVLENVEGFKTVREIGDGINFTRNHSVQNVNGLSNVQSLGDNLIISDNDSLVELDSLENISSINGYIVVSKNDLLTSIEGIRNIDPFSVVGSFGSDLRILDNLSLEECSVRSVCALLTIPGKTYEIENNKTGCNDAEEIECFDLSIGGYTFYDTNANGIQDENEFGISNQSVLLTPDGHNSLTDINGLYYLFPPMDGNYEIEWQEDPRWTLSSDSSAYNVEIINGEIPEELFSFGLTPNFSEESATVSIASQQTRCNELAILKITYQNTGTFVMSGELVFNFDENSSYVFADQIPDNIDNTNQIITWNIDNLYPQESREITLILEMPSEIFTGTFLDFSGQLILGQNGNTTELAITNYSSEVRCSYDPNDKLVNPIGQGTENLTTPDTTLNYTVRFQNTGNAEAINIHIIDTIDNHLDMETFRVNGSSFPVQTIIRDDIVRFNFNNIYLPDSLSDPMGSQGFVSFSIDPVPNLPDPTEVYNSASIYFDENPPIKTNTALTIYGTPMVSVEDELLKEHISLYPNPVNEQLIINIEDLDYEYLNVVLKDLSGKSLLTKNYTQSSVSFQSIRLDLKEIPSGIYFISFKTNGGRTLRKVVKK